MALRVLLIAPRFYGIEKIIKAVLEESDYEVTWLENKVLPFDYHGTKAKIRLLRKLYFLIFSPQIRYLRNETRKIENFKFDILFSINANIICPFIFRKLKRNNPDIYSILYLWDSFSMYNWAKELKLFNKVYTFDPADSERYKLEYKPNFFIRRSTPTIDKTIYDMFFVGKFSPKRLLMIDKLVKLPDTSDIKMFLKLWPGYKILFHNQNIYNLFKKMNFYGSWIKSYTLNFDAVEGNLRRDYLMATSMNYVEMQNHLLCSNVILDLPYEWQTGYTHRVIEALANGKKVITTNSHIRKESFYNPDQIHLLDNKNPEIDCSWIKEKTTFQVNNYFCSLELSAWLKSILNVTIA